MSKVVTTPLFWDCECDEHYIHPKTENYCINCGAIRKDQPDSRVDEVEKYFRITLEENQKEEKWIK